MKTSKPILVTGSHRSGTTWIGKMISSSPEVAYIHEPFNLNHRLGICGAKFEYWFTYINDENEKLYYNDILRMLRFNYNLKKALTSIRAPSDIVRLISDHSSFLKYRSSNLRPLIKDPIAILSAEWLVNSFNMDAIVLVRHPAAFVSSLKRMNWTFPLSHLLAQKLLMEDLLQPFENEIIKFTKEEQGIIDQAILLWRIIYYIVSQYKKKHKNWLFLRHEDISRNPLAHFEVIFDRLSLPFTSNIKKVILEHTNETNPKDDIKNHHNIRRNSRANIWNWKNRLSRAEISYIKETIEDISQEFYSDSDWDI